ncbi:pre-mRNA splicing factor prp17 [Culex quinquefasciatus]|uniref:Pre-mRNA splicing factor prp17 n=1 Tax=Culex quinquefasciatus TaxID=7176 RepID=B0XKY7_CULQU|nr:pre-mRNA splicing factor prp17 [Culex quinquefasciatus]|eukprot:XP_001870309.1 pre-mRNA splicing factor prp17 [Culex quinquefasciatus]
MAPLGERNRCENTPKCRENWSAAAALQEEKTFFFFGKRIAARNPSPAKTRPMTTERRNENGRRAANRPAMPAQARCGSLHPVGLKSFPPRWWFHGADGIVPSPRYEEMFEPMAGPENPGLTEQMREPKNILQGRGTCVEAERVVIEEMMATKQRRNRMTEDKPNEYMLHNKDLETILGDRFCIAARCRSQSGPMWCSEQCFLLWGTCSSDFVQEYERHLGAVNSITFND